MIPKTVDYNKIETHQLKDTRWDIALKDGMSITNKYFKNHQLGFGTLLGAVRDGTVIPHDIDLDVDVILSTEEEGVINDFKIEMASSGFTILRERTFDYLNKDLVMSVAYKHNLTKVIYDICFFRLR